MEAIGTVEVVRYDDRRFHTSWTGFVRQPEPNITNVLRSHPLLLYFILAFALFWSCIGLGFMDRFHFWVPILGAFAPAVAAIIVSGFGTGEHEVRALLRRLADWRVGFGWYLVVLGLPFAGDLFAAGLASVTGVFSAARIPPILPVLPAM